MFFFISKSGIRSKPSTSQGCCDVHCFSQDLLTLYYIIGAIISSAGPYSLEAAAELGRHVTPIGQLHQGQEQFSGRAGSSGRRWGKTRQDAFSKLTLKDASVSDMQR